MDIRIKKQKDVGVWVGWVKRSVLIFSVILFSFGGKIQKCNSSNSSYGIKNNSLENGLTLVNQDGFKFPNNYDPEDLTRTFGYIKGQQYTLERIKKEFPELETEVIRCELEFSISFGKAVERINKTIASEMTNEEFVRLEAKIMDQLKSVFHTQAISKELAVQFLNQVEQRANGNIESPVLETLLTFQYIDNPSQEFLSGFVAPYSTKNHPKAKGVTLNVKLPVSWRPNEGERPNVIQNFTSQNGYGMEMISFMVKDLELPDDYEIDPEELNDLFSESELRVFVPEGSEVISAKRITIDNLAGGQIIYKLTQQQMEFSLKGHSATFVIFYDGKLVFMNCGVPAKEDDKRFNEFLSLFRMVANSMVFPGQY